MKHLVFEGVLETKTKIIQHIHSLTAKLYLIPPRPTHPALQVTNSCGRSGTAISLHEKTRQTR